MTTRAKAVGSLLALAALLGGPAADATDVAALPLKASVLVPPNLIIGMDDSASMDAEFLLDTTAGRFWWDGSTGWDGATRQPRRDPALGFLGYTYLLPVGMATGGQIHAFDHPDGRALPPTRQFGWLRSAAFNPIYYDTGVTYTPWAPAFVDGALRTYAHALPLAAPSHPAYPSGPALNLGDDWNAADALWAVNGHRFYVQAGMVLPAGTQVAAATPTGDVCHGGSEQTLTADVTVPAGRACWASIPYYPATFWHAENCVPAADCVLAPDGVTRLKRYDIRNGGRFPSGRSYSDELQNFANWFSYHRKRKLMLAASVGAVLDDLTGPRLGLMRFTEANAPTPLVTMADTQSASPASNGKRIAGEFYKNAMTPEGRPTHATLHHMARQFNDNPAIVQSACQRNGMVIVTDGPSDSTAATLPSWDPGKSTSTWGSAPPFAPTPSGSLADLALRHYTNRLRTDLPAGRLPPDASSQPNADRNADLHLTTAALVLGERGLLWPTAPDPFLTPPAWPPPLPGDRSMIDDLWHATINGRGQMHRATRLAEAQAGLRALLQGAAGPQGAQGSLAVSTVNLSRGDAQAYAATYNPAGWQGDLTAHPLDTGTGAVDRSRVRWSAAEALRTRDWRTRVIATASGSSGAAFTAAAVGATVNPGGIYGDTVLLINYLRGERTHEGTLYRTRASLIGAVINAEPVVQRAAQVVYVASGEGMLHAIDTAAGTGGTELWAFVPPAALPRIGETASRGTVFGSRLDGTPSLGTSASGTLLVAGMGAAGRSFYALDVNNPRGLSESALASRFKWQFPAAGDAATAARVGQALGRPRIVTTSGNGPVVLVTSGYNNTADGRGRLWMLNADTGAVIHTFDTGVGTLAAEAGLAQVTAFAEANGTVRYAYGGDLLGNVWRFDLDAKGAPSLLATLKDSGGAAQPVTAAPELTWIDDQRVVIVGTGRLLGASDFGNPRTQSLYVIVDGATLNNARLGLVRQTYNPGTDSLSGNVVDWRRDRGWMVDLPAGEQVTTAPAVASGAVTLVTNKAGLSDCAASSRLYVFNVKTAAAVEGASVVSSLISSTAIASRVTAVTTRSGQIVGLGQDADGTPWQREIVKSATITPARNAWREIRRQ